MEQTVKTFTLEETVKLLLVPVDQYVIIRKLLGEEDVGMEQRVILNGINVLKKEYEDARGRGDKTTMNETLIRLMGVLTKFVPTIIIPHTDALHYRLSGR